MVYTSYTGHGLDSLECGDISLAELDHHLSDAAAFQEPLEEDFQKMLSEWETHIGSLATGEEEAGGGREENNGQCRPHPQPSFRLGPSNRCGCWLVLLLAGHAFTVHRQICSSIINDIETNICTVHLPERALC